MSEEEKRRRLSQLPETERDILQAICSGHKTEAAIAYETKQSIGNIKSSTFRMFGILGMRDIQGRKKRLAFLEKEYCRLLKTETLDPPPPETASLPLTDEEQRQVDEFYAPSPKWLGLSGLEWALVGVIAGILLAGVFAVQVGIFSINTIDPQAPSPRSTQTQTVQALGTPTILFSDDFADGDAAGWSEVSGSWNAFPQGYNCPGGGAQTLVGDASWRNYTVTVDISKQSKYYRGAVLGRVQDDRRYYEVELLESFVSVHKHDEGGSHRIGAADIARDTHRKLKVMFIGTLIYVYVEDKLILLVGDIEDDAYMTGKIGLECAGDPMLFDNVIVSETP